MGSRQEPVSNDLLRRLLTIAAAEPDAERFARAVNAAQRGKMVLDEQAVLMTSLEQVLKSGSIVYIFISQSSIQYMIKYWNYIGSNALSICVSFVLRFLLLVLYRL